MRHVTYGAACSLDGFIARTDGGVDWLRFTPDAQAVMRDYWSRIDTVLMGRKTWEVAASSGASGGGYPGVASFVFSRTLERLPHRGAELVREDAAGFVRALKQSPGKDICVMGGGDFARSLLEAGVIDEIGINVHPVVLGSGVPLFLDPRRQVDLELTECRQMAEGCVLLRYRVAPAVAKPRAAARRRAKR
ncbi:MAG TPA: dihydrofolate reductase family protein [Planctomycetota bacterium]|nr:dihydrofolate reductase family protein [Planctomycetota bacterium]